MEDRQRQAKPPEYSPVIPLVVDALPLVFYTQFSI